TLLTLVVVPVLFTYVDNFMGWLGKLFGGKQKRVPQDIVVPNGKVLNEPQIIAKQPPKASAD
ncbi:MAG: hypothetical protein GDA44_12690, partial [Prochloron sp. SP5CPC1]|nr:hypothetical protein [Candidatus Paraprochloron terpiosi SP5CPC1]